MDILHSHNKGQFDTPQSARPRDLDHQDYPIEYMFQLSCSFKDIGTAIKAQPISDPPQPPRFNYVFISFLLPLRSLASEQLGH